MESATKTIMKPNKQLEKDSKYSIYMIDHFNFDPADYDKGTHNGYTEKTMPMLDSKHLKMLMLGCNYLDDVRLAKASVKAPKAVQKLVKKCINCTDNNIILKNLMIYKHNYEKEELDSIDDPLTSKLCNNMYLHMALNNPHVHITLFQIWNDEDTDGDEDVQLSKLDKNAPDYQYQACKVIADFTYTQDMAEINCYKEFQKPNTLVYNGLPCNFGNGKSYDCCDVYPFIDNKHASVADCGRPMDKDFAKHIIKKYAHKIMEDKAEVKMLNNNIYNHKNLQGYRDFYLDELENKFNKLIETSISKVKNYDMFGNKIGKTANLKWYTFKALRAFDEKVHEHNVLNLKLDTLDNNPIGYIKGDFIKFTKPFKDLTFKQTKELMKEI